MDFKKPTSPEQPKKEKVRKPSLFSRLLSYTANDSDLAVPLKIVKVSTVKKPLNLKRTFQAAITILIAGYILLCAFVLMNPQYALFFNNVLGVQYLTIRAVLEYTIYVVYSVLGIILGAGFLFFGFRALAIRTKNVSKRVNIWLITWLFCMLFFSNVYLFARTYDWFRKIDFNNLDSRVLVYDTTILKYIKPGGDYTVALINPDTKIGPLNVRYDMSAYIKKMARLNGLLLTQPYTFWIDYDGDGKSDRGSGDSNFLDQPVSNLEYSPIISPEYPYDTPGKYSPKAWIRGIDVGGKSLKFDLELPSIDIQKVITISRNPLSNGGIQYTFDATPLADFGQVYWSVLGSKKNVSGSTYYEAMPTGRQVGSGGNETKSNTSGKDASIYAKNGYQFAPETLFEVPTIICMQVFRGSAPLADAGCDWKFVTEETTKSNIQNMDIAVKIDPLDPLKYQFSIDPKAIQGNIDNIRWFIDKSEYVGKYESGTEKIFDYTFHQPGTYTLDVEVIDTLGNTVRNSQIIYTAQLVELKERYNLQITDEAGDDLDTDTYDKSTKFYLLPDFPVPDTLSLNATSVRANSARMQLVKVEWDSDGIAGFEKEGFMFEKEIPTPGRYGINVRYTFTDISIEGKDIPIYHFDRVALVGVQKPIDVRLKITPEDSYAPTNVRFDASGSKVVNGDIRKFIYDFGDGKTYEGEGTVRSYRYENPGEYRVTVTAITSRGEKATKTFTFVLKKQQETVHIIPSISSGRAQAGSPVTFDATVQGTNNIITWDMGDGTGDKTGQTIVYTYNDPGTYTIHVKVQYTSGVIEEDSIKYTVVENS